MRYLTATAYSYVAPFAGITSGDYAFELFCSAVYYGRAFTARNVEVICDDMVCTGVLELQYHPSEGYAVVYESDGTGKPVRHINVPQRRKGD